MPEDGRPKGARVKIDKNYTVKNLINKRKLPANMGSKYCFQSKDSQLFKFPLPKMFAYEKYAFFILDVTDPRFISAAAQDSKKLDWLKTNLQILHNTYSTLLKSFFQAERALDTLPAKCDQKVREEKKRRKDDVLTQLKIFQTQLDLHQIAINQIDEKYCAINKKLQHEVQLKDLCEELTENIKNSKPATDPFWSKTFNVTPSKSPDA